MPAAEIENPKPKKERPPARCPECASRAGKDTTLDWYYCLSPHCRWAGMLDSSCDICDRPMKTETYACYACRNVEY